MKPTQKKIDSTAKQVFKIVRRSFNQSGLNIRFTLPANRDACIAIAKWHLKQLDAVLKP